MNGKGLRSNYITLGLLFVFISCTGVPKPEQEQPEPLPHPVSVDTPVPETTAKPAPETVTRAPLPEARAEPKTEPLPSSPDPKAENAETGKAVHPKPVDLQVQVRAYDPEAEIQSVPVLPRAEPENVPTEIIVSEEVYNDTFNQIEIFIQNLNGTIRKGDYSTWLTYLTEEYKRKYDNSQILAELSESPILKGREIKLKSIQDYFNFVVVPSRTGTLLNKIVFTGEDHIRAVTVVQDVPVILYSLIKENGIWKVATE